jgi:SAM-dependent methyltransferase
MNLFQEYRNQQNWRNWSKYIEHLPISPLQSVLDLGSSVGGFANEISGNVAMVTGLDINQEFVDFCQSNARINQKFVCADISQYDFSDAVPFDGAWSSFSLSYLREPESVVRNLHSRMNNFGWIALVDVSCFLSGNMSRSSRFYSRVRNFELKSGSSGGYDLNFGSKMWF